MPQQQQNNSDRRCNDLERHCKLQVDNATNFLLMERRVLSAGLDLPYLLEAKSATYAQMRQICCRCRQSDRCRRDLDEGDWEAGQRCYCPNAATIDLLLVSSD